MWREHQSISLRSPWNKGWSHAGLTCLNQARFYRISKAFDKCFDLLLGKYWASIGQVLGRFTTVHPGCQECLRVLIFTEFKYLFLQHKNFKVSALIFAKKQAN
jgi:hypothetical protein